MKKLVASTLCLLLLSGIAAAQQVQKQSPSKIKPVSSTVVVLGSPEPISEGESSRSVVVLDTQEHPLAFQTLEDYLRTDSSVDIQQRGAAGVQSDISIRGASFEQTLVLLNGLRINDAETSHFNLDLPVPLHAIHSIDVLHGAGSTLYGSDAIGGVVDFVTAKPETTALQLRTGVGSFGENQQAFVGSVLGRKWSETLAGSRDFSTGFIPDRDYRTEDASSETWLQSSLGQTAILFAGSDRPFGADQFYGNFNSWERTKGWFASLRQELGSKTEAAVAYRRHADIFVLFRNDPAFYKNQHLDESWEGALRRKDQFFQHATVFYGLEANTDAIQSNSLGHHGRNQGAGYVDLEAQPTQQTTFSVGLREEVLSGGRSVLSPTFAGSIWVHPTVKLRASAGYGFRLPTYIDLYYSDPSTIGNPNLKPESAWNYDGGVDWYPTARTAASLTVFYSRQQNAIDYVRASTNQPWQATNLVGLRFTGVESALQWQPVSSQRVRLGWTLLSGAQDALHGLLSEYVFNYPTNNASFEWTSTMPHGLLMRTHVGVTQRYHQEAYPVWDLSFAREAGRIQPFLQITNFSNTGYQEIAGVPMPGRSFVGGFQILLAKH
ncbi:MAG: TonB-dependent receptor plug domain-containing protein [Acidobacteriaceae bacterium]